MTTTRTKTSEKPEVMLGRAIRQYCDALHNGLLRYAFERRVIHPTEGLVYPDMLIRTADETVDCITVCELKASLNDELVSDCLRWVGLANHIEAGFFARATANRESHARQIERLVRHGVGVIVVNKSTLEVTPSEASKFYPFAKTQLLIEAFNAGDSEFDPAPGSAAAHRMNGDRALLCQIAKHVGDGMEWNEFKPKFRTVKSAHQLRKLIDSNADWPKLPLDYDGYPRSRFFATGRNEK